ncbi:TraX family protein [Paraclostridium bifermentans]|uniref:TraX family protein n=1 Tax=Paraclostridium bifermentans TaxID=1490 RepID=A0ABY8R4V9_PARBF|nr:TraX family protein [Paraclostridium bifermentans]
MKKFNAFQIKVVLLILMLLDHLWFAFPNVFPSYIHGITRVVSPMFAYFLVEGFFYTRSRTKYGLRLLGFAIFMESGNYIINLMLASKDVFVNNNIMSTLFIGFVIINLFELSKNKLGITKIVLIVLGIIISVIAFINADIFEGSFTVIPFIIITYCFRGNFKKQAIGYLIIDLPIAIITLSAYTNFDMLMFNSDFLFVLVIPVILLYNGERGLNNKFSKYMFYVFYPLHLWIIAIIEFMVS